MERLSCNKRECATGQKKGSEMITKNRLSFIFRMGDRSSVVGRPLAHSAAKANMILRKCLTPAAFLCLKYYELIVHRMGNLPIAVVTLENSSMRRSQRRKYFSSMSTRLDLQLASHF